MMMRGYQLLYVLALVLVPGKLFQAQDVRPANVIHIQVEGLRNNTGQVICSLYSSPEGFPKNSHRALARGESLISGKQGACEFRGVEPGTYAVSVFHDENSNDKLDTGFLGIPREGVGASNGATGHFGPPKFKAAAFHYSGGRLDLKITIKYL